MVRRAWVSIPGRGGSCRPLIARQHPLAVVDSPRAMAISGLVLSCGVAGVGRAGLKDVWVSPAAPPPWPLAYGVRGWVPGDSGQVPCRDQEVSLRGEGIAPEWMTSLGRAGISAPPLPASTCYH